MGTQDAERASEGPDGQASDRGARGRALWRLAAWATTLAVLFLCFTPGNGLPSSTVVGQDKVLHALGFFGLALTWRKSGLSTRGVLLLCVVLAVGTEIGQHLLHNGRTGDIRDVVADLVGAVAGVLVAVRWPRL